MKDILKTILESELVTDIGDNWITIVGTIVILHELGKINDKLDEIKYKV